MSSEPLSRRRLFVAGSALAVTAAATTLPAIAEALPAAAPTLPPVVVEPAALPGSALAEPSAIEKLWNERQVAWREYEAADKLCRKLEQVLERRMPEPHPSIVWGGPNKADGLEYWVEGKDPPYFKRYIFSGWIETKLECAREPKFTRVDISKDQRGQITAVERTRSKEEGPFPFTDNEIALQERLASRLELSRRYERRKERMSREIGLAAARRRRDKACDRQCRLERKILNMSAVSSRDFVLKIAIYDFHNDGEDADIIIRDLKRLLKQQRSVVAAA